MTYLYLYYKKFSYHFQPNLAQAQTIPIYCPCRNFFFSFSSSVFDLMLCNTHDRQRSCLRCVACSTMSDKGENEGGAGTAASDMSTPDAKEELETKTRDFISSVVDLAKTEASQTKDELQVLEQMNTVAASEYAR